MAKDKATAEVAAEPHRERPGVRAVVSPGRWHGVDVMAYKQDAAAPFRAVTRQVLFADPRLSCEWRYFEVAEDGYSTLEQHEHVHAVMIHRGRGQCLVGRSISDVAVGDLVFIPPMTWHQFRANAGDVLGFLCLVNAERDRPQLPGPQDLAALRQDEAVANFIRA